MTSIELTRQEFANKANSQIKTKMDRYVEDILSGKRTLTIDTFDFHYTAKITQVVDIVKHYNDQKIEVTFIVPNEEELYESFRQSMRDSKARKIAKEAYQGHIDYQKSFLDNRKGFRAEMIGDRYVQKMWIDLK